MLAEGARRRFSAGRALRLPVRSGHDGPATIRLEIIMKTETYVPEPCVVLKIIGLRAGPVAVGPK